MRVRKLNTDFWEAEIPAILAVIRLKWRNFAGWMGNADHLGLWAAQLEDLKMLSVKLDQGQTPIKHSLGKFWNTNCYFFRSWLRTH